MKSRKLFAGAFASAFAFAFLALACAVAHAIPLPPEFEVTSGPDCLPGGGTCADVGHFTVVNNSDLYGENLYVWKLVVGNQQANLAITTQNNWSAFVSPAVSCIGNNISTACYGYENNAFDNNAPSELANDIGPGQSSSNFFWGTNFGFVTLPFELFVITADGSETVPLRFGNTTLEPDPALATPLPAALPLFVTGLGALGLFGWRRKRKADVLAA